MSVLKVGSIQPNSGAKVNITGSTLLVTTASGHFSGSYEGDGSRLSGVAGLRVSGSTALTGSLFVSGTVSGSFIGDGSGLTGLATNLTVDGDTGTQDVSLTADDLQILGTTNEISTAVTKVSNDVKVTLGLPDTVAVTASVATRANALAPTVTATSASVAARATTLSAAATSSFANISTLSRAGSGSFSGSFQGSGASLTGVGGFPHTGSAAISGTLNITGSGVNAVEVSGSLVVTGSAFVTSLTETSALRYKKSIKDINRQADDIYQLRPVHFTWRNNNKKDFGLIAEEVQKIYPELVTNGADGSALGISYTKLTALLLKTIQGLNERIEKLENKN